jgi:hypothetical protein
MRKFYNKFIVITCLLIHCLFIESAPLPAQLTLSVAQFIYLNDFRWAEDARQANAQINHFVEPPDTKNYADYRYVGSHNAFTDPNFFKIVRQQDAPILTQLAYGVRGLMLDTYNWNQGWPFTLVGPSGAKVCLSHGAPGFVALIQKGVNYYQSLKYELRRVVEFMRVNPQAVITIILENYADLLRTSQEIKEVMREAQYDVLLRPSDVVNNQWPTLGWMRQTNKRLVIFTQRGLDTDVTFNQFSRMIENQYSTTDEGKLCHLREESHVAGQQLVAFNNFPGIAITAPVLLTKGPAEYTTAKRITTNCQVQNFANRRLFNGYWIDRVIDSCNYLYGNKEKTIFEYVNDLNANPNTTMP